MNEDYFSSRLCDLISLLGHDVLAEAVEQKRGKLREVAELEREKQRIQSERAAREANRRRTRPRAVYIAGVPYKPCPHCRELKPCDKPSQHKLCEDCQRERYWTNRIRRVYNLTPEEYAQLNDAQQGLCAICGAAEKLVVDHCHETGRVRGLLCTGCNIGLGRFRDSPHGLRKAAEYLEKGCNTPWRASM